MAATAYHGTPITPDWLLESLCVDERGQPVARNFCVSYFRPDQIILVLLLTLAFGGLVMLDNGAFSAWRMSRKREKEGKSPIIFDQAYWAAYYEWVRFWLRLLPKGSWFVIPDVIDAGTQEQDALIRECPQDLLPHAWPVWHMDEPIERAIRLGKDFGRFCIGATGEYELVGSPAWRDRMDELFSAIAVAFPEGAWPETHMLRGLQCFLPSFDYPIDQADSTAIGRNHNREKYERTPKPRGRPRVEAETWELFAAPSSPVPRRRSAHYLWSVRRLMDRWDSLAAARTQMWPPSRLMARPSIFGEAA